MLACESADASRAAEELLECGTGDAWRESETAENCTDVSAMGLDTGQRDAANYSTFSTPESSDTHSTSATPRGSDSKPQVSWRARHTAQCPQELGLGSRKLCTHQTAHLDRAMRFVDRGMHPSDRKLAGQDWRDRKADPDDWCSPQHSV